MFASTTESPVLLIGAAHVVDLESGLRRLLADRPLDAVAVELDPERAASLFLDSGQRKATRREGPFFLRLWSILQRRLGAEIGAGVPGAEMKVAAALAKERKLPLALIDDPIRQTIAELLRSMSLRERVAILVGAVGGLLIPSRVVARQIDRYAQSSQEFVEELRHSYPTVAHVLLDQRNEHMADRLTTMRKEGYGRIVAVVGDAHLSGLAAALRRRGVPSESIPFQRLRLATGP